MLQSGHWEGTSIVQLISTFEEVTGKKVPYTIHERRLGDIPAIWGDCSLAKKELNWEARYTLKDMCDHFWSWMMQNPKGYPRSQKII